jgi:hypothetical protein
MMTLADCERLEKYLEKIRKRKDYETERVEKKQRPQNTRPKVHTAPHIPD